MIHKLDTFLLRDEFRGILGKDLTEASCLRIVEIIKYIGEINQDDEIAHYMEDAFREAVLKTVDSNLAKLALSTSGIEFSRWCS